MWTVGTIRLVEAERKRGSRRRGETTDMEAEENEEEEEEEGKKTILAKDRRYSNALVAVASASAGCVYDETFLQSGESHGCRTTVIFSLLVGEHLPFFPVPPSLSKSCPLWSRPATKPHRAKTDASVPFRVSHRALVLIAGKYSDTQ